MSDRDPAKPGSQPADLLIQVQNADTIDLSYANFHKVQYTNSEFHLTFVQVPLPDWWNTRIPTEADELTLPAKIVSRIVMTPETMEAFTKAVVAAQNGYIQYERDRQSDAGGDDSTDND